ANVDPLCPPVQSTQMYAHLPYTTLFRSKLFSMRDRCGAGGRIKFLRLQEFILSTIPPLKDLQRRAFCFFFAVKKENKQNIINKRSEEHTSELQSREKLVCRHLLEKKNMS